MDVALCRGKKRLACKMSATPVFLHNSAPLRSNAAIQLNSSRTSITCPVSPLARQCPSCLSSGTTLPRRGAQRLEGRVSGRPTQVAVGGINKTLGYSEVWPSLQRARCRDRQRSRLPPFYQHPLSHEHAASSALGRMLGIPGHLYDYSGNTYVITRVIRG